MKKRNGFVSNSSSSSFIIGLAFAPSDRIAEITSKYPRLSVYDYERITSTRMFDMTYSAGSDEATVSAFDGSEICLDGVCGLFEKDPMGAVVVLDSSGAEPTWDDDYGSYNYSSVSESPEWFNNCDLNAADLIRELGGDVVVGGGFNG